MSARPRFTSNDSTEAPPGERHVTLTMSAYIQLTSDRERYKTLHAGAVTRDKGRRQRYQQQVRKIKADAAERYAALHSQIDTLTAKVRDLTHRLFGKKGEHHKGTEKGGQTVGDGQAQPSPEPPRKARGQQRGAKGHGRTLHPHLPAQHETVKLDHPVCQQCHQPFTRGFGSEDAEVVEIEVRAYRRIIHRERYKAGCQCKHHPGIITAPRPAQLIPRGKFGVSVWVDVLLDKFAYGRPSHRWLQDLATHGLHMSAGTLAGGLQTLLPLFKPVEEAIITKLRSEHHWHADETRWAVFIDLEGKVGHRWYLWVFHSPSAVYYALDPTRSAEVIERALAGVEEGKLSVDRYSAYKKFASLHLKIVLAFCWAHVRRDFLEVANAHPTLAPWALLWVDAIANLYHLNAERLQAEPGSAAYAQAQTRLEQAIKAMVAMREKQLANSRLATPAAKVLTSMANHWSGLTVFVEFPWVPMDNNTAERAMRGPVVGRNNFRGSGALWAGNLAATMYGLLATLKLSKINPRTWLTAYLQACADNGGQAPQDINAFLPWSMDADRLRVMRACPVTTYPSADNTPCAASAAAPRAAYQTGVDFIGSPNTVATPSAAYQSIIRPIPHPITQPEGIDSS